MRKESKAVLLAALFMAAMLIAALVSSACSNEPENTLPPVASGTVVITPDSLIPTNDDPSLCGYITRITYAAEYTEILVEYFQGEDEEPEFSYSKVLVKLDDKSAVAYGMNNEPFSRTSLAVGSEVEVWFSDPTAESYPVLAYGQAVRVVSDATSMTKIRSLPCLSVSGNSTCITVVTKAEWGRQKLEYTFLGEALEDVIGAHISALPGDVITLKFSHTPVDYTAVWSDTTYGSGTPLEIVDGKLTIPEGVQGNIYIRIDAKWLTGSAQYAFSVTLPDNTEQ